MIYALESKLIGNSYRRLLARFLSNQTTQTTLSRSSSSSDENSNNNKKEANMDRIKANPYFAKYENKLKAVYNQDPEAFATVLKNQKAEKIGDGLPGMERFTSSMAENMNNNNNKKKLDSIMKTELVAELKADEIATIWKTYMEERAKLADMLHVNDFAQLRKLSKEFTTFLLPLPKQEGYEFIMLQWLNNECHFTPLINYQAHGENAPSILTAVYFDDLAETKSVVLEMAEFDTKALKKEEAAFLLSLMKNYYLKSSSTTGSITNKLKLLSCFNRTPASFKHMDLIDELNSVDKLTLDQLK